MNIRNKNVNSAFVVSALFVAFAASASAFAADRGDPASLAVNEQASRAAIVDSVLATVAPRSDAAPATLARNEGAAQRALVDVAVSDRVAVVSNDAASLARNELAAQRVIADTRVPIVSVKANRGQASAGSASDAVSVTAR